MVWIVGLMLGPLALTSTPSHRSPAAESLRLAAGGCSAWPGDTVHHYRPARPEPRPPPPREASDIDRDLAALGLSPAAFPTGPPDLTGTWAQPQTTSTLSTPPLIGDMRSSTTTLLRLELSGQGDQLISRVEVCDIETVSGGGMQTHIPDAFVRAIPPSENRVRLERAGEGYRIRQEQAIQVLGAVLSAPESEPLPTEPNDPRVVDQDQDGQPGMTIRLEGMLGGDLYLVQRVIKSLVGVLVNADRFDGLIDLTVEQTTLGASSFLLNVDTALRADPTPANNTFRTTRVAADTDCATIVEQRDRLF